MKGKYLITTDNWFYAPNGQKYRAVWGEVEVLEDSILGIKTNRNASNWFAKVGSEEKHVLVAGCQIHYCIKCEERPNADPVIESIFSSEKGEYKAGERPSDIWIAE